MLQYGRLVSRSVVTASPLSRTMAAATAAAGKEKLFDKILIANRGEIACRVMRTAKRLGIKTVAVYSDPDASGVHVRMADEAVCIGPARAADSYLNVDKIVEACLRTGAQAVHPGYGFLSEKHRFASALEKNNIVFMGPPPSALVKMGDKIESKQLAKAAKVNVIPGYTGIVPSAEEAVKISRQIGYPVMIKASGGGGGKGMRIAWNDADVMSGFKLCKEEAMSSFGDDRMFVEKYIQEPRHIEIQIMADAHGNVIAFPERECSIQRRNQKVIEESPSVLLSDAVEVRRAMMDQACMLARAVGYRSAGTCEFLCDKDKNFYFLEMNTRLQVEHPVTEQVTGVDLVEQMFRVAAGHPLPEHLLKGYIEPKGWAMESRVYAEDPLRGFLPSTGTLGMYREPPLEKGVRCDAGVREGGTISMFYDPMICKLITYGANREEVRLQHIRSLDQYVVRGVGHNIAFLRDLLKHPRFASGRITTNFIKEEYPDGFHGVQLAAPAMAKMAGMGAVLQYIRNLRSDASEAQLLEFVNGPVYVTIGETAAERKVYEVRLSEVGENDEPDEVATIVVNVKGPGEAQGTEIKLALPVDVNAYQPVISGTANGESLVMQILEVQPEGFKLQLEGGIHNVAVRSPTLQKMAQFMPEKKKPDTSNMLLTPMPGMLKEVMVEVGQTVEEGQELVIVEAMKMANVLRAPKHATIKSIQLKAGASMAVDEVILTFESTK